MNDPLSIPKASEIDGPREIKKAENMVNYFDIFIINDKLYNDSTPSMFCLNFFYNNLFLF